MHGSLFVYLDKVHFDMDSNRSTILPFCVIDIGIFVLVDNQQEGGYQNLMLKTLDRPAGIANTRPPRTSLLDSTIEVYQELNPRIQPENPYSALASKSASHASIKSNVDINTEEYQNTAACTEAILPSNYQELNSDCNDDSEYNSVSNE